MHNFELENKLYIVFVAGIVYLYYLFNLILLNKPNL